jgi:hypothetical protein
MKRILIVFLLLLVGCASADKSKYQLATADQIQAKIKQDNSSKGSSWNIWRYAGSDDSFDYIYEYNPGIFLSPDSEFEYFKLNHGQVQLPPRTDFKPDKKTNIQIFND